MGQTWLWVTVRFLHDVFTAAWIGGMITLVWAVLPAAQAWLEEQAEVRELITRIQRRLSVLIYVSMLGLWGTGFALARRAGSRGLLNFASVDETLLTVKHLVVMGMVALALIRSIGGRRTNNPLSTPSWQRRLLLGNLALGLIVIGLSAARVVQ